MLDEILKREDDPRMTLYALEMIQTVGSRRTNGIFVSDLIP